jgi:hypothetical protein
VVEDFGGMLLHLGVKSAAFAALSRTEWETWLMVAAHWRLHVESWPSQATLGQLMRVDERTVRAAIAPLVLAGFLTLRKERQAGGWDRIYYAPGPVALAALEDWVRLYPKGDTPENRPPRPRPVQRIPDPVEVADPISDEPVSYTDLNFLETEAKRPLALAGVAGDVVAAPPSGTQENKASTDRGSERTTPTTPAASPAERAKGERAALARETLAAHHARKHPDMPPPRLWNAANVALVVACLNALPGDIEAQRELVRDALSGAVGSSRKGFPTLGFVFGRAEWTLDHAAAGKRMRLADAARARQVRAKQERLEHVVDAAQPSLSLDEVRAAAAAARAALDKL